MTTTTMAPAFPEDILIATLYKIGKGVRISDDRRLADIFDEAAKRESIFARFKAHPQYRYSKLLSDTLQTLDLGGAIVRDNAPLHYFRVSDHAAGPFGESKFLCLSETDQVAVASVAEKIRSVFGA